MPHPLPDPGAEHACGCPSEFACAPARADGCTVRHPKSNGYRRRTFCEGVVIEMAFLGALSVHVVELLELTIGKPELERHEGNARF